MVSFFKWWNLIAYITWKKIQFVISKYFQTRVKHLDMKKLQSHVLCKRPRYSGKNCLYRNEFHACLVWYMILPFFSLLLPKETRTTAKTAKNLRKGLLDLWQWNKKQFHEWDVSQYGTPRALLCGGEQSLHLLFFEYTGVRHPHLCSLRFPQHQQLQEERYMHSSMHASHYVRYESVPGSPMWDLQFCVHLVQKMTCCLGHAKMLGEIFPELKMPFKPPTVVAWTRVTCSIVGWPGNALLGAGGSDCGICAVFRKWGSGKT